jgi:hypothetical protein
MPWVLLVLPALPTTASGKLDRAELSRLMRLELEVAAADRRAAG